MSEASNPKISVALPNVEPRDRVTQKLILKILYVASIIHQSSTEEEEEEESRPHETASKITGYRFAFCWLSSMTVVDVNHIMSS